MDDQPRRTFGATDHRMLRCGYTIRDGWSMGLRATRDDHATPAKWRTAALCRYVGRSTMRLIGVAMWLSFLIGHSPPTASAVVFGSGGSATNDDGSATVFVTFRSNHRPGLRAHGLIVGTRKRNRGGRIGGGPSLTLVVSKRGRLQCVAHGKIVPDGRCYELQGGGCGVASERRCSSATAGSVPSTPSPEYLALTAEDAPTLAVGKTIRGAGITCIVISNEELLSIDPTATSKDLIACRQGASAPYRVSLFEEGTAVFDCYVGADPATGCLDLSPCFDSISPGLICP